MTTHRNPTQPRPEDLKRGMFHLRFRALGTKCELQFKADSISQAEGFRDEALGWVRFFENRYSRFLPDSLISRINTAAGQSWVAIDEEDERIFGIADELYRATDGTIDPTALPVIRLWDFRQENPTIPTDEAVAEALKRVGWKKVQREPGRLFLPEPGMALDLGGFGKELAVDEVAALASAHGISDCLVDFGHDIAALGKPPGQDFWHIGLEDPAHPGQGLGGLALRDKAVATSGDYRRFFEKNGTRFGHIIDPRTGHAVMNGCRQATVVADSCLEAGALATTAFILGPRDGPARLEMHFGAEGRLVTNNATISTQEFYVHTVHVA